MGVMKVTDSDGNVGYIETTIDLSSTNPSTPARVVQNRELVSNGSIVSNANPLAITITNWNSGAPVAGPGSSTTNAVVRFTDTSGHSLSNTSILIDPTTGLLADVGFAGTLQSTPSAVVTLGTSQNDYNPGTALLLSVNPTANISFTGFTGGQDGRFLIVRNVSTGSFTVGLTNASGSSQAANRIQGPSSTITLAQGASALLIYDSGSTCWRVVTANYPNCDVTYNRNQTFSRYIALSLTAQPQIAANQNDYGPNNTPYWQISSDAARSITGMAGTLTGSIRVLENTGSFPITLLHLSGLSAAGNQFSFPDAADYVLAPGQRACFLYDGTNTKWKALIAARSNLGNLAVASLPALGTAGKGFTAFATNGRKSGEGAASGTGVPCYFDGSNWKTYYDNSTVAA
jgi:hypothetical protein